tara:strand:+ start:31040 stop:33904 length:2865 start_codon:yes stop_codon:yes gene_type:complete
MSQIEKIAKQTLLNPQESLSALSGIDCALAAGECWAFEVSLSEYREISAAYGLVLNNNHILVMPYMVGEAVEGFVSIYDKLQEKLAYAIKVNFKDVRIVVFVEGCINYDYIQAQKSVAINNNIEYSQLLQTLNDVGFECVDRVDLPRQYSIKGGVVDFYSPIYDKPIRMFFYDDTPWLAFYELSTGLSIHSPVKEVVLTKRGNKNKTVNVLHVLEQYKIPIYKQNTNNKKGKWSPFNYEELKAHNKGVVYSKCLHFSAYKYNDMVFAPLSYKGQTAALIQPEDVALERGDYVCHEDFGVGVLSDFVLPAQEEGEEFIKIQYSDGVVRVSMRMLNKVSFVSRETSGGRSLHSISKKGVWKRQKNKTQAIAEENVKSLVVFYKNKQTVYRPPYIDGGGLEKEFLLSFKYQDTPDQEVVWTEIKKDLEDETPMYRLLCGDVGFGKTELCMRAAFRVVVNGGQVLVLVPTSVLAMQHLRVFKERFKGFGVNVSAYTRFISAQEKRKIKEGWIGGGIDILIGTSSFVYDSVFIKHAGLFVIDEEHRFGVKEKEGLLGGVVSKDVLLMSATPIPRSLNLGLSGLSSISVLRSPPILRKPIQTFVHYYDDLLIQKAVNFEVDRGGQVFFVHNNVASILSMKRYIEKLCPMVRVIVAHAQLPPKDLEKNMLSFIAGNADLLLCTSIIGSGVDIPNVNTIVVNLAHRFGLGQLHQIRGRVGRSNKQGFAHMVVPKGVVLTQKARLRLKTIEKNISLGSGYSIAKSDLEIRGGGVMFGYKQSGKSFDFGFEFYSKLMSRSVFSVLGDSFNFFVDNFVYNVDFACLLSQKYIQSGDERLRCYRLLNTLYSKERVLMFRGSLLDRFGPLPYETTNLLNMRLFSFVCFRLKISHVLCKLNRLVLSFDNSFGDMDRLLVLLGAASKGFGIKDYKFKVTNNITALFVVFNNKQNINGSFLLRFVEALNG